MEQPRPLFNRTRSIRERRHHGRIVAIAGPILLALGGAIVLVLIFYSVL